MLLDLAEEHLTILNHFHVGNLWNKLGRHSNHPHLPQPPTTVVLSTPQHCSPPCALTAPIPCERDAGTAVPRSTFAMLLCRQRDILMPHHQTRLASLLQWTAMVVSSFNSRAHSNVAHGVAKSGLQLPEVKALLTAVAEVALRSGLEGWAPQALSNLIWAYATARVRADALFAAVEREVASSPRGLDSYEAQNLSNLAWAYATAGVQADSLYAAIADAALRRKLRGFSPQNLSNIVWAYATAGRRTDSLFSSAAAAVTAHAAQGGLYEYQARTNPARPSPSPSSRRLLSPLALDLALPRLRCCSTSLLALAARAARSRC